MQSHLDTIGPVRDNFAAEIEKLVLRWRSARRIDKLPLYEDVALGSLGPVADHLALVEAEPSGAFRFLGAGPGFEGQVGLELRGAVSDDLAPNYRIALEDCMRRAMERQEPAIGLARCVFDGFVSTCDLVALPLKNRWGGLLILCYLRRQPIMHDLVEATYRSTSDGLLALAAVAGAQGDDFQVVSLNGIAAALFGRPEAEIRWQLVSNLAPRWGEDGLQAELVGAMVDQEPREFEYEVHRSEGVQVYLRISVAPVGDLLGVALTDVTDMKRREDSVRLLFESNPMPLLVYDCASLRIRSANEAMTRLCGLPAKDLLALTWHDLVAPKRDGTASLPQPQPSTLADAKVETLRMTTRQGEIDVEIYANNLSFDGQDCVLASVHDVTAQRRAQADIAYLAHYDHLTGLCNRALFRSRLTDGLSACREKGEILAVLCIDLDHFKQVNDTLGHQAGDELLRAVGERISDVIGPSQTAARLGGDEFAAIVTGLLGPEEVSALAERLVTRIAAPYMIDERQAVVGASIGISLAPDDGCDPDIMLHNADIALYRSKSEGRGTLHFFEAGMDGKLLARRTLEADLRLALGRNEFELFYQPILDAGSMRILGFEALLRWFHPERGAVPPSEFIPIAEDLGVIDAISDWVLNQACAEAVRWPDETRVAVNLSAVQFRDGKLPAAVATALRRAGLAAGRLELEITESVFLNDSVANLDTLHRLRAIGVAISLDDFGTGYSSLGYLNRFPFDKIKIDRSFIRDLETDPHGLAIIRAVVSLGASLGIRTLAEGVETPGQLARLRDEGCTEVQGFLLARPMPAPRLSALLSDERFANFHVAA